VVPSFRLKGNFEVTGTYNLLSDGQPSAGKGGGVALELASGWVNNTKYARIGRLLRPNRHGGNVYLADHWVTDPALPTSGGQQIPTATRTGQLRLLRQGSTLRFLVADDGSNDFREIDRTEFGADDLFVRFTVNNNCFGSPTKVDAHLVDLQIHAAGLTPADPPPGADEDGQANLSQGGTWKTWLVLGLVAALALGLGLAARRSLRAGKTPAGAAARDEQAGPEAASPSVAFPCSACGTKLKAKSALAGKRVKCPKCARAVVVPDATAGESPPSAL
jgi:DNA-directed RNA polymerase subunit RPC12/RpoP